MKKMFYLIAIAGIVMASCSKTGNPNPNEKRKYSLSIGAQKTTSGTDETRVENIDGVHHWSVDDRVGLMIMREGSVPGAGDLYRDFNVEEFMEAAGNLINSRDNFLGQNVVYNLPMTGEHGEPTPSAHFRGELTYDEMLLMHPDSLYDYGSYYPYAYTDQPLVLLFGLMFPERGVSVQPNVFPAHVARLFGTVHKDLPPMTWLDENEEQQWSPSVVFNYWHTLSYLRLRISGNDITSAPVSRIEVRASGEISLTILYDSSGLNFELNRDQYVDIEDGMYVDDEVYIPIVASGVTNYETNMTFEFYFTDNTSWSKTIQGGVAEPGKIHPISFYIR